MAMIEVSVVPVGTGSPSVSEYVAGALQLLRDEPGIKYELTAMGTIIEGDLQQILTLAGMMHRSAFETGAKRVVTTIKVDERKDKSLTIRGKVESVETKLLH